MSIQIKKSGFNIPINDKQFFFSTNETNIIKFFELEENYKNTAEDYGKKFEEIDLQNNVDKESVIKAFEVMKAYVRELVDPMLGEGAFDTLYEEIGETRAIYDALPTIIEYITTQLEKEGKKREVETQKAKAKALMKQKNKQK